MHKAMYERVYSKPYEIDERDRELLAERVIEWDKHEGPRVGDFLVTSKGLLRLTHDWGDDIQTTVPRDAGHYSGSFYFSAGGYMSFSGSLDPAIAKTRMELTPEVRQGACWFFSHDHAEASNGVHVEAPCRVYRLLESDDRQA